MNTKVRKDEGKNKACDDEAENHHFLAITAEPRSALALAVLDNSPVRRRTHFASGNYHIDARLVLISQDTLQVMCALFNAQI